MNNNKNTMKKLFFLLLIFCNSILQAQNPDIKRTYHWYFGNKAGLDFSNNIPVAITNSAIYTWEGSASISDTCGNLLFYTNGDTVWNRDNQIMANGTGLYSCISSTQAALIIPQPGNDSIYYLFTTDCGESAYYYGLRYSIININKNGGLGAITNKNVLLYTPSMEKLAATYHANGTDIWILSCNKYLPGPPPDTTFQYYAYLLTSTGVNPLPVISPSVMHPPKTEDGYLHFSHHGNKVANAWHGVFGYNYYAIEILDFDNNTGILSNPLLLDPADSTGDAPYGLIFSPDDSKLYHSIYNLNNDTISKWYFKIFQYDLSSNDSTTIASSKTLIQLSDSVIFPTTLPEYMAMQTGSDGKIYIAKTNTLGAYYPDSIDVISNPNATGLACNYVNNGVGIGGGAIFGLPNFVDSYFSGSWQPPCNIGIEDYNLDDQIFIYPNPFNDHTTIDIVWGGGKWAGDKIYLSLFDLLGREVQRFINLPVQSFTLYKGNLRSGIYLLKIQIGNYNYIHKLIIN
jgi:hypothetical protein